jgi:predicted PolB exonuclease-like 3'-5' exonuclease
MDIVIDIETIPTGEKLTIDEIKVPATMSKQDTIDKWKLEKAPEVIEEEFRKRALIQHKCQVISWAIKTDKLELALFSNDEKELLTKLNEFIASSVKHPMEMNWIGVNIKSFDMTILRQRSMKYGLRHLYQSIPLNSYSDQMIDLMQVFTGSKHRDYLVSKDDMCKFFDIKIEDIHTGKEVYDLYLKEDYEAIRQHCLADVIKEYELYNKMYLILE